MTTNLTKIAAGASLLGVAALAGAALAPRNAEPERKIVLAPAPPPLVRTMHIRRVTHRTIHVKPRRPKRAIAVRANAAAAAPPAAARAASPAPVPVSAVPPPAPVHQPISTRTSGSPGSSGGDDGHERESGHGDD